MVTVMAAMVPVVTTMMTVMPMVSAVMPMVPAVVAMVPAVVAMVTVAMVAVMTMMAAVPNKDMAKAAMAVMMMLHLDYLVLRGDRGGRQWRCDTCRETDRQSDGRGNSGQHCCTE